MELQTESGCYQLQDSYGRYKGKPDSLGRHPQKSDVFIYAEEADLINLALFGLTAKQWREKHQNEGAEKKTIRDSADTHQLIVLSNLENLNATWIRQGIEKKARYEMMREAAISQLASLQRHLVNPAILESPARKKGIDK